MWLGCLYKNYTLSFSILFSFFFLSAQSQKPLDVEALKQWKSVSATKLSNNGLLFAIEATNQNNQKWLQVGDVTQGINKTYYRAEGAEFSASEEFVIFKLNASNLLTDSIKLAKQNKLAGANKAKLPPDTAAVFFFEHDSIIKFPYLKNYATAKDSGNYFVIHLEKNPFKTNVKKEAEPKEKPWWMFFSKDEPEKKPERKHKPTPNALLLGNCQNVSFDVIENVKSYALSNGGERLAYIQATTDTADSLQLVVFNQGNHSKHIFKKSGSFKQLTWDAKGNQLAFLHSADTNQNKQYSLYHFSLSSDTVTKVIEDSQKTFPKNYSTSEWGKVYFSNNGNRLFFGYSKKPTPDVKDSVLNEHKPVLDIWSYTDQKIQPHQLKQLKSDLKNSFPAYYHTEKKQIILLGDTLLNSVIIPLKGDAKFAYGLNSDAFIKSVSWQYPSAKIIYSINAETGEATQLLDSHRFSYQFSPDGNYLAYYVDESKSWMVMDVVSNESINVTGHINSIFYDEEHDTPSPAPPYGIAGFSQNNEYIFIEDAYDIWAIRLTNPKDYFNLTKGQGKKQKVKFTPFIPQTEIDYYNLNHYIYLTGFSETTKETHFYRLLKGSNPEIWHAEPGHSLRLRTLTRFSNFLLFTSENFSTFPDVYFSDLAFKNVQRITHLNPQQANYLWGNVELINFTKSDGESLEGLVFLPPNYDENKAYPAIIYYYEKYADSYKRHFTPRLSASIINPSHYASNDYIVFIPDITYKDGYPGKSALDAVLAGTKYLTENYAVNPQKIGLQGQSWGGYQTAFIITQTNKFAAAMAGAPVSNMTSAYGGIRWGSGYSRMFQYENTQSRIGNNLWDATELYIYNSPLFFADKVNTPLLMMHNDNDGAVPWYQGIEYFMALRRLNKPVWMLNYNDEAHNLTKNPNKEDLTIRMMQFFNHYLKDEEAPYWLKNGISAKQKGYLLGY